MQEDLRLKISNLTQRNFNNLRSEAVKGNFDDTLLNVCLRLIIDDIVDSIGSSALLSNLLFSSFNDSLPTASVDIHSGSVHINRNFFIEQVRTLADLVFILMHERGHIVLAYLSNTSTVSGSESAINFAEDCLINASIRVLCRESLLPSRMYSKANEMGQPWMALLGRDRMAVEEMFKDAKYRVGLWRTIQIWYEKAYVGASNIYNVSSLPGVRSTKDLVSAIAGWCDAICAGSVNKGSESDQSKAGKASTFDYVDTFSKKKDVSAVNDYKKSRPDLYDESLNPKSDGMTVSFLSFSLPTEVKAFDLSITNNCPELRFGFTGRGTKVLSQVGALLGGFSGSTVYHSHMPSLPSSRDIASLQLRGPSAMSLWEHEAESARAETAMYVDFSASMEPFWGLAIWIVRSMKQTITSLYGFAMKTNSFKTTDVGVTGIGSLGTNVDSVIDCMKAHPCSHVIWLTDLDFFQRDEGRDPWYYSISQMGARRKLSHLTIIIPKPSSISKQRLDNLLSACGQRLTLRVFYVYDEMSGSLLDHNQCLIL